MHERLFAILTKHKYIYDLQFGFRTGHSTNQALLDLTEDIRKAIDENKFAVGVFIDLQKAFDTWCHNFIDTPSGICLCNQCIEDTSHFLFSRHLYATQRVTFVSSVNEILQKFNLNYLKNQLQLYLYGYASLNNTENKKIILSTIKYIKDTRRFST